MSYTFACLQLSEITTCIIPLFYPEANQIIVTTLTTFCMPVLLSLQCSSVSVSMTRHESSEGGVSFKSPHLLFPVMKCPLYKIIDHKTYWERRHCSATQVHIKADQMIKCKQWTILQRYCMVTIPHQQIQCGDSTSDLSLIHELNSNEYTFKMFRLWNSWTLHKGYHMSPRNIHMWCSLLEGFLLQFTVHISYVILC